jgi:RimJ/RimL family protein N-acetyltransferase
MPYQPLYLNTDKCVIRPWKKGDEPSLVRHADNRNVWMNVRDTFPSPYTVSDAKAWVNVATRGLRDEVWAIDVAGFAVGGISLHPEEGVHRYNAEIGYWLGEEYWGQGIATAAVRALTRHAFEVEGLVRLYAAVFEWNDASKRVLEKCGYAHEGTLRMSVFKAGRFVDQQMYAAVQAAPAQRS